MKLQPYYYVIQLHMYYLPNTIIELFSQVILQTTEAMECWKEKRITQNII